MEDQLYHMITELECLDYDFDDLGVAYEITNTPQTENTPHQPVGFIISNEQKAIAVSVQEAWQAGAYLEDFYSQVIIVSENNEQFVFTFDDMELAGFTEKYLDLHNQQMPDGSVRKVLRAGMYGFGAYTQGTKVVIDPSTGDLNPPDDIYDLYYDNYWGWMTGWSMMRVGFDDMGEDYALLTSYVAFDTEITEELSGTSSVEFEIYVTSEYCESGEGMSARVYNIGGNADSNTAKENSLSYSYGTNKLETAILLNPGIGWKTLDTTKSESLTDYWASNRNDNEDFISFQLSHYLQDAGTDDYINFDESTSANDPVLCFDYVIANDPPHVPTYVADSAANMYGGKSIATIKSRHTDPDGQDDVDDCRIRVGDSSNYFELNYNVDTEITTETAGAGWVSGAGASKSSISYGYEITWTFTPDWDFPFDDTDYDLYLWTDDKMAETRNSGWLEAGSYTHENDLIVYSMSFTLGSAAYSEDGNTELTDDEWFRGGTTITASGTLTYEGTTTVYPGDVCDVQFWADGSVRTTDTSIGANGAFSCPAYTTVSTGIDTVYALDCTLTNLPSGASESSSGAASSINVKRDNEVPSISVTSESESSQYLDASYGTSIQGVYGSLMGSTQDFTIAGTSGDGSGSGMESLTDDTSFGNNPSNTGSVTSWEFIYAIDSADNGDITVTYTATDDVGNTNTAQYTFYEDNTAPTIDITSENEASKYLNDEYGTIYQGKYNSTISGTQQYSIHGTTSDAYGVVSVTDDTTFGNNPSMSGSVSSWGFYYEVETDDNGDTTVTYTATDRVSHTATVTYTFYEVSVGIINAVTNAGFETGDMTGWSTNGEGDITVTSSDPYADDYCLQIGAEYQTLTIAYQTINFSEYLVEDYWDYGFVFKMSHPDRTTTHYNDWESYWEMHLWTYIPDENESTSWTEWPCTGRYDQYSNGIYFNLWRFTGASMCYVYIDNVYVNFVDWS